jgi:D-alanyl-D-alanine carboxypeptidase
VVLTTAACQSTPGGATAVATGGSTARSTPAASTTSALAGAEARVRAAFASYVADGSGAVVLVRLGKDTAVLTQGLADVTAKRALTPQDRFPVASLTKSMVATAVLQFVASGKIALDDPVDRYLPGVLPSKKITVRQLLSHRSGLHVLTDEELEAVRPRTYQAEVKAAAARPLDFPPGTDGSYNNSGYMVLGMLVEKLSGTTLAKALQQRVFTPAGMATTTLAGTPTVNGYSGYRIGQRADELHLEWGWAAGGVVSTVQDVDRFYSKLFSGDLLPAALLREMEKPTGTSPFGFGDYGLGLWIDDLGCGPVIGHSGSIPGFNIVAWSTKDHDRAVVAAVNTENHSMLVNLASQALCG